MAELTGKEIDGDVRKKIVSGASDFDLVRSGLDDTMRIAFQNIREVMKQYPEIKDYRTAAYVLALGKIVQNYEATGLIDTNSNQL